MDLDVFQSDGINSIFHYSLQGVGPTLCPSCRLSELEAGLEALRAGSGA